MLINFFNIAPILGMMEPAYADCLNKGKENQTVIRKYPNQPARKIAYG